jgi:hypothetical protein
VTEKTVAEKAHLKPGTTLAVINRVPRVLESLGLPKDVAFVKRADADLVLLFVRTRAELETRMPAAVGRLRPGATIWVFFQKSAKQAGLDMNRDTVWASAEKVGLRPLGLVAVDERWSVFRLKPGKPADGRRKAGMRGCRTSGCS